MSSGVGGTTMKVLPGRYGDESSRFLTRFWASDVVVPSTASITYAAVFVNGSWSTNYFVTGGGLVGIPIDLNVLQSVIATMTDNWSQYKINRISFKYHAACATSTSGQLYFLAAPDPVTAVNVTNNLTSAVGWIKTSPGVIPVTPFASTDFIDITNRIDTSSWKFLNDTSITNVDDLRLSLAGTLLITGFGLPAQTASSQGLGSIEFIIDFDVKGMVNPNIE